MVMKMAENELARIDKADLANGHHAYFVSIEGKHTPGLNSDYFYLNQDKSDQDSKKSRLLALITDGVSGKKHGSGHYAAKYICENLPTFWETDLAKHQFRFGSKYKFGATATSPSIGEIFDWMVNQVDHDVFPVQTVKYVMRRHADLLLNHSDKLMLGRVEGKTAEELAKAILIEPERLQEVLRLLVALYQSLNLGIGDFEAKYRQDTKTMPALYAGTTSSGVIETKDDYILFGVGDSPLFMVDEIGPFQDKKTRNYEKGSNILSAVLGWTFNDLAKEKKASLMVPPGCKFGSDGKVSSPSFISIVFQPKKDLFGDYAIVGLTDGFGTSSKTLEEIGDTISLYIRNCRWAVKEVVEKAIKKDELRIQANPAYAPDDKTMIVIRKSAPEL